MKLSKFQTSGFDRALPHYSASCNTTWLDVGCSSVPCLTLGPLRSERYQKEAERTESCLQLSNLTSDSSFPLGRSCAISGGSTTCLYSYTSAREGGGKEGGGLSVCI
jgi:hypothetical protein